ncbi:hypothetical protein [Arcanobacterium canis]
MNTHLTPVQLREIFEEDVVPRYINEQQPQSSLAPVFASVGGQPGSGKGGVLETLNMRASSAMECLCAYGHGGLSSDCVDAVENCPGYLHARDDRLDRKLTTRILAPGSENEVMKFPHPIFT